MHKDPPPLVLVPGIDGTALLFYRQIPLLAERFRVSTFPLPDQSDCTMDSLVDSLREHCDRVAGGQKVTVCGESFGGALSLSYALFHPETLHRLVIVNSFPVIRRRAGLRLAPLLLKAVPWGAMNFARPVFGLAASFSSHAARGLVEIPPAGSGRRPHRLHPPFGDPSPVRHPGTAWRDRDPDALPRQRPRSPGAFGSRGTLHGPPHAAGNGQGPRRVRAHLPHPPRAQPAGRDCELDRGHGWGGDLGRQKSRRPAFRMRS